MCFLRHPSVFQKCIKREHVCAGLQKVSHFLSDLHGQGIVRAAMPFVSSLLRRMKP